MKIALNLSNVRITYSHGLPFVHYWFVVGRLQSGDNENQMSLLPSQEDLIMVDEHFNMLDSPEGKYLITITYKSP